jgi:hypothetical protein
MIGFVESGLQILLVYDLDLQIQTSVLARATKVLTVKTN